MSDFVTADKTILRFRYWEAIYLQLQNAAIVKRLTVQ